MSHLTNKIVAMRPVDEEANRIRHKPRRGTWTNYLYIVPILAFVIGLIYYGIGFTAYTSLLDWNGLSANRIFIGLQHYGAILQDPIFWIAIRNTAIFGSVAIIVQMIIGLIIALMLKSRVRLKTVYKIIFFLPTVIASTVVAYTFRRIYDANGGNRNEFLTLIGLGSLAQAWLADPHFALLALTAINIWQWTGFSFIIYYAALSLMEEDLNEAARIDGANTFQIIRFITIPLLRPSHISLIILGVIGALKTFDIVFLTTGGGPGRATELLSTYIYKKELLEFNAGYASALSMILFIIALVVTAFQLHAYRTR